MGAIKVLRIEIDGHFHGSGDVPKPWVAQITGVDAKYGLARTFVDPLRDWRDAHRSCRGNVYGVVAAYPLRDGRLYEVSRLRGRASKRYVAREFLRVADGQLAEISATDALAEADGYQGPVLEHDAPDGTAIALVPGLGTPDPLGFVLVDGRRHFRLRCGALHQILDDQGPRLAVVTDDRELRDVTHREALQWLLR